MGSPSPGASAGPRSACLQTLGKFPFQFIAAPTPHVRLGREIEQWRAGPLPWRLHPRATVVGTSPRANPQPKSDSRAPESVRFNLVAQSCPDSLRPPWTAAQTGFPVHHQLMELTQKVCCQRSQSLSRAGVFATPWTAAHQAPLSVEFSRQEHWSGLPFPSPGDLTDPGVEPRSPALQADS